MSFASRILPRLDRIRAIPGKFGLRPYTVTLLLGQWSGSHTGDGSETQTSVALTCGGQPPKVRWVNDTEIALGQLHKGDANVGPVTPVYLGGGVDPLDFGAELAKGETLHVLLTGPSHPDGALYRILHAHQERAMHFTLTLTPVSERAA